MRQAIFNGPGELRIEEGESRPMSGSDVLVQVEACGVCGSDRAIFAGTHPASSPVVLGHEFAGTVVACGDAVAELTVGDRVTVDPNVVCGRCRLCRRGAINLCQHLTPLGIVLPGGFAEYAVVPASNAYRIGEAISFDEACLVEPLACCVRGINQADVQLGDVVVVLGAGPIGLLLAQLARLRGAAVVVSSDPIESRRGLATKLGVDIAVDAGEEAVRSAMLAAGADVGADVAIESSGRLEVAELAVELVRPGGTVVWFGVCPEDERVGIAPFHINDREITIRGSNVNPFTHQTALTLIESRRVDVASLVSDRIGLAHLVDALVSTAEFGSKVVVHPGNG
jgi:2-desacetyl-2-hydroxyethyl bacteriochlorophyllide A dehydrogenase